MCILQTCVIMTRPSEVCEYCPSVESLEIPTQRKDWCDDNIPKWIKLGLPHWKGKKILAIWKFYLHRNMVDVRFCPVTHVMLWLNASEIKRGPLFPKIRNGNLLVAFRINSVTIDQRTMNQWVCEKNDSQVHMSYCWSISRPIDQQILFQILWPHCEHPIRKLIFCRSKE